MRCRSELAQAEVVLKQLKHRLGRVSAGPSRICRSFFVFGGGWGYSTSVSWSYTFCVERCVPGHEGVILIKVIHVDDRLSTQGVVCGMSGVSGECLGTVCRGVGPAWKLCGNCVGIKGRCVESDWEVCGVCGTCMGV